MCSVALKTFYSIQNVTNWHLVRNESDIVTISNPIQWVTVSPYTPEALGIILSTITCFQMFFREQYPLVPRKMRFCFFSMNVSFKSFHCIKIQIFSFSAPSTTLLHFHSFWFLLFYGECQ